MSGLLASLALSAALQAVPQAADYASTRHGLTHGGREGNPVLVGSGLLPKKLAAWAVLTGADYVVSRRSKRAAWILRGVEVIGFGLVVRNNLKGAK